MAHEALIDTGRYRARFAAGEDDLRRAQALRARVFRGGRVSHDQDEFDARCRHVLIEAGDGALVGAFRLLTLADGREIATSYSAQFYDLSPLASFSRPVVEVGRFCLVPGAGDADVMRVVWAAFTRLVDGEGIGLLFGCSSFAGTDPFPHRDTLALLAARHLGPAEQRPGEKAACVVDFTRSTEPADLKHGQRAMPPLLRAYLGLGGWVSDHAVIDRDLGTLHVFTALEVAAVPPARARILREIAASRSGVPQGEAGR